MALNIEALEKRLDGYMEGLIEPEEIATRFNTFLRNEFFQHFAERHPGKKDRDSLIPFVGQYRVCRKNPEKTRVYNKDGTGACTPLSIYNGVIGRAVRTGRDQYVPDVTNDSFYVSYDFINGNVSGELINDPTATHVSCDKEMEGSELVLVSWSEPYGGGEFEGCKVPFGVLDIDLNVKEALSEKEINGLRKIWDRYGKLIFPGEPTFAPKGELFIKRKEVNEKYGAL